MEDVIPFDLTEKEFEYLEKVKKVLDSLLNDLKIKNIIRTDFQKHEIDTLIEIIKLQNRFFETYNMILYLFKPENEEKCNEFLEYSKSIGITKEKLPYFWLSQAIQVFLGNTESFKSLFLIILKKNGKTVKNDMTLGRLLGTISQISPLYGSQLKNEIDLVMRNAFAHGLYFQEGPTIHYYEDISLSNQKSISLSEFMMKSKNHNILFQTFILLIGEKVKDGFFR